MSGGAREERVPAALDEAMRDLLARYGAATDTPSATQLLDCAIAALRAFVRQDPETHDPYTLLAIDAIMTRAFAAAASTEELTALADRASRELIALGADLT